MGYIIALCLLLFSPTSYQASLPEGSLCDEVAQQLDEYIEQGGFLSTEERDSIVDRCVKRYS